MSAVKSDESDSDDLKDNQDISNLDSKQIVKMVFRKPIATTPISILVESLVRNLVSMIETNEDNASKLYNTICNKLFEMKLIDESYQMTEFEGMRSQYQRALYHLVTVARGEEEAVTVQRVWPSENISAEWSHYKREFDEIEYIAGGGFGQVFRVRHKLDGTEYAVKKIYIRSNGIKSVMNYLAEVKTFASLNHSNIVQYKAAWLELGIPTNKKAIEINESLHDYPETDSSSEYNLKNNKQNNGDSSKCNLKSNKQNGDESSIYNLKNKQNGDKYIYPKNFNSLEVVNIKNSSEFTVQFESPKSKQYSYSNNNITTSRRRNRESRNSVSEGGKAICNLEEIRHFEEAEQQCQRWATLFIQMALCQITLKQWLEKRNEAELSLETNESAVVLLKSKIRRDAILDILEQILKGLRYIHSKKIVHHDIKPSNIFMQMDAGNLSVQLGDFGLACPLQSTRHSLAFGTKLYAAPEQLAGKCNPKSDMYSLGIVLLELVETFHTDMERVHHINELRKGRLSSQILAQEPQLAHMVSQLVSKNPNSRPDASQLLERLKSDESEQVRYLKSKLAEKDIEIALKDVEISRLKQLLKTAGIND